MDEPVEDQLEALRQIKAAINRTGSYGRDHLSQASRLGIVRMEVYEACHARTV